MPTQADAEEQPTTETMGMKEEELCMDRKNGIYSSPMHCYKFIMCTSGLRLEFDCPEGMSFSSNHGVCVKSPYCSREMEHSTEAMNKIKPEKTLPKSEKDPAIMEKAVTKTNSLVKAEESGSKSAEDSPEQDAGVESESSDMGSGEIEESAEMGSGEAELEGMMVHLTKKEENTHPKVEAQPEKATKVVKEVPNGLKEDIESLIKQVGNITIVMVYILENVQLINIVNEE